MEGRGGGEALEVADPKKVARARLGNEPGILRFCLFSQHSHLFISNDLVTVQRKLSEVGQVNFR
jgi:hypothetical protein